MTSEQIDEIRNQRAFNVPWHIIARRIGRSVAECRAALNMPVYVASEPAPKPWEQIQRTLNTAIGPFLQEIHRKQERAKQKRKAEVSRRLRNRDAIPEQWSAKPLPGQLSLFDE